MKRFFHVYQYAGPVLLIPLSYYCWWRHFQHDHRAVWLVLSVPIVSAYVIPGLGTNWLKLWEFDTRWHWGRFRPHHGFVFGSATAFLAFLALGLTQIRSDMVGVLAAGFVLGSVLGFWNWLYDIYAIKTKFLIVHNKPQALRQGPEVVATDYAPVYFGTFGCVYGVIIHATHVWQSRLAETVFFSGLFVVSQLAAMVLPVAAHVLQSYSRHGISGLRPYRADSSSPSTTNPTPERSPE